MSSEEVAFYSSRVKKLDGDVLDQELHNLLFGQLNAILKALESTHSADFFYRFKPEIEALIKFYVWKHTVNVTKSTIGQSLFGLKLFDSRTSKLIGSRQAQGFLLFTVIFPYLKSRLSAFTGWRNNANLESLETIYKVLNLANFVIFLNRGSYPHLWQRFLRMDAAHTAPSTNASTAQLEAMNRELLWHGFSQFLMFILPFVSFHRIRNLITTWVRLSFTTVKPTETKDRSFYDVQFCAICSNTPSNPHEIGCAHVFCYYCIMSNYLADSNHGFDCPLCLLHVHHVEGIRPLKLSIDQRRS